MFIAAGTFIVVVAIVIFGSLAQQALNLYTIVFRKGWEKEGEMRWERVEEDVISGVLTNAGLVATWHGWQWDGSYIEHWVAMVDAKFKSEGEVTVLEIKVAENKLEMRAGKVEMAKR